MGVKGLWRLLLPIGRRISIETLEGKILAVDASIWLTQFLKAMRDPATGKLQTAAHLVGFFRRLCRLQYHGIKAVFVFDGASPEIKLHELALRRRRREQFAATSDETVQRLARRLLAEQLQKQAQKKKSMPSKGNNGGAYAAGFNPGGQAEEEEETQQDGERRSQQNGEGRGEGHGLSASGAPKDQASGEEVVILDDEDDEGEVNDWDMKPAAAQPEEHIDESEDDSDTEWKVVNDAAVENEDDEFLVNHIASLPANKRKEAIEDAKRRQRLRSRREFMPAAANPNDFSQVQLQNFLRSSRLNQSIVKMASAAAARDNHGLPGEAMASDPTTRLELIREDEEEEEKNDDINIFKTYSPKKRRPCRLTKKKDPDSSSDDESWGEGVGEDKNPSGNGSSRAQRRVIDDDSDGGSDSSDVQVIEARGPPQGKTNGPSSFDKMPSGGGEFLAKSSDVMSPTKPKGKVVIDVDDEGEKEAGGFLKHSDDQTETNVAQDYAGEGGFVRAPEPEESIPEERISTNDAAYAQELEDRALAKALQEEEDTFTTQEDASETFLFRTADKFKGTVSEQEMEEHLLAEALQMSQKDFGSKEGMATLPNQKKGAQKPSRTAMVPSNQFAVADDDEETSEDEVDWEDGDMSSAGKIVEKSSSDNSDISPDDASLQRKESSADLENDFIKGCESPKSLPSETGRDQNSWELLTETAAALERAQTTASSLANWAGRAFRRAVLEANVPESLKNHSPHRDRNNVTSETAVEAEDSGEHLASTASLQNPATVTNANDANESVATATCVDSSKPTAEQFISSITEEEDARWTAERNRRERDTDTVTDEMLLEAKQLLQLFGVPYVEAPAEAESQCAELERLGLVDGIVTEDSDVFVFGGKTVYKNIFDEQKYAEIYRADDAEREMNLGHNAFVALAMLLGSDYTEGVKGVGIVNAMEVLESFDVSRSLEGGLEKFKKWLDGFDLNGKKAGDEAEMTKEGRFRSKHKTARKNWVAPQNFPAQRVMKAYLEPVVDKSRDRFSWGAPDVESLAVFCRKHIGWRLEDTKRLLDDAISKRNAGLRQTRIDSFMHYEHSIKFAKVRSKRLRDVLGLPSDSEKTGSSSKSKKRK